MNNSSQERFLNFGEGKGEGNDEAITKQISGIYHLTAPGKTSWYGYAQLVLETAIKNGQQFKILPNQIVPIMADDYPLSAKRPLNPCLDTNKFRTCFGLVLPLWQQHAERATSEIIPF
jgi:dTDP-4-dehydrorhamnose reductase